MRNLSPYAGIVAALGGGGLWIASWAIEAGDKHVFESAQGQGAATFLWTLALAVAAAALPLTILATLSICEARRIPLDVWGKPARLLAWSGIVIVGAALLARTLAITGVISEGYGPWSLYASWFGVLAAACAFTGLGLWGSSIPRWQALPPFLSAAAIIIHNTLGPVLSEAFGWDGNIWGWEQMQYVIGATFVAWASLAWPLQAPVAPPAVELGPRSGFTRRPN